MLTVLIGGKKTTKNYTIIKLLLWPLTEATTSALLLQSTLRCFLVELRQKVGAVQKDRRKNNIIGITLVAVTDYCSSELPEYIEKFLSHYSNLIHVHTT